MGLKSTEHTIDLSNLEYRDYSDEEVKGFRRVRSKYSQLMHPILKGLEQEPTRLVIKNIDYKKLRESVGAILDLEEAELWLTERLEMISETRRAKLSELKPTLEQITSVAESLKNNDPQLASMFAKLFDYLSEPGDKAAKTKREKQNANKES